MEGIVIRLLYYKFLSFIHGVDVRPISGAEPLTIIAAITAAIAATGTTVAISSGKSAKKKQKGQMEQAERIRAGQKKQAAELEAKIATEGEEASRLETQAKASAAAEQKKKQRRRRAGSTILTGPRGALEQATTSKPTLLGG